MVSLKTQSMHSLFTFLALIIKKVRHSNCFQVLIQPAVEHQSGWYACYIYWCIYIAVNQSRVKSGIFGQTAKF